MNNTMPMLTDSERLGHIERCEKHIKWMKEFAFNRYNDHEAIQQEIDIYQIALAALTAEAELEVSDGDVLDGLFPAGTLFFTAPPVPALKLPDEMTHSYHDKYAQATCLIWNNCLAEVKRLNGVTK